jgi:phosphotransferase system HPr-like phosphotransfer protein
VREQGRPPTQYFYCILALCATLGASLEIEVVGDDEQNAVEAVERVFMADADAPDNSG